LSTLLGAPTLSKYLFAAPQTNVMS